MKKKSDVIIVGAGPSGSAAAYVLASAGMRVALVDKKIFPRDKLCGGLLSGRTEKIFKGIYGEIWGPTIEVISHGVGFYYKDQFLNGIDNYSSIYFTSRKFFDAYLLELAEKKGAVVYQGVPITSIEESECGVIMRDGQRLQADFIIGADGVNSRIASEIFPNSFNKRKLAFGLEIEVSPDQIQKEIKIPEIYFGVVRWGYGWVFPKKASITIGIAGLLAENPDISKLFARFIKQICGGVPHVPRKGHYVPFGSYKKIPGKANILLVGDAAGLVEPISGEGISFALLSGKFAAESVLEAARLGKPRLALDFYKKRYKVITDTLAQANLLRYLLFPKTSEYLFAKALPRNKSIIKKHMDLLSDKIDYPQYSRFILKKVGIGVLKAIVNY